MFNEEVVRDVLMHAAQLTGIIFGAF